MLRTVKGLPSGDGDLHLRPAKEDDAAFVWRVTEACMKAYAEQTWGYWDGQAKFDLDRDEIITRSGQDIGVLGVDRFTDHWFLAKLYLLPALQDQRLGSRLLKEIIADAAAARLPLRLTVLEVNPARLFYERHGFIVTRTVPPRHHMEYRNGGDSSSAAIYPLRT